MADDERGAGDVEMGRVAEENDLPAKFRAMSTTQSKHSGKKKVVRWGGGVGGCTGEGNGRERGGGSGEVRRRPMGGAIELSPVFDNYFSVRCGDDNFMTVF